MGYELVQLSELNLKTNTALGIDLNFGENGVFTSLYNEVEHASAQLKNLLQTVPNDRFYHPSYGCDLMRAIFEPSSMELKEYISNLIQQAILNWLPQLTVTGLDIKTAEDDPDSPYNIQITLNTELNGTDLQQLTIFATEDGIATIK